MSGFSGFQGSPFPRQGTAPGLVRQNAGNMFTATPSLFSPGGGFGQPPPASQAQTPTGFQNSFSSFQQGSTSFPQTQATFPKGNTAFQQRSPTLPTGNTSFMQGSAPFQQPAQVFPQRTSLFQQGVPAFPQGNSSFPSASPVFAPSTPQFAQPGPNFASVAPSFSSTPTMAPFAVPSQSVYPGSFGFVSGQNSGFGSIPMAAGTKKAGYRLSEDKEGYQTIKISSLLAMQEYQASSIEELRLEDHKHNKVSPPTFGQPTINQPSFAVAPQSSLFSNTTNWSTPTQSTFAPNNPIQPPTMFPTQNNTIQPTMLSTPRTTQPTGLFAVSNSLFPPTSTPNFGPAAMQPQNPLLTGQPSLFGNTLNSPFKPPAQGSLFGNPQPTGLFASAAPAGGLFGGAPGLFSGQNSSSLLRPAPVTAQQQPIHMFPASSDVISLDTMRTAFSDPHGLSWLYPNKRPEEVLKEFERPMSVYENSNIVEKILKNSRKPTSPSKEIQRKSSVDLLSIQPRKSLEMPSVLSLRSSVTSFSKITSSGSYSSLETFEISVLWYDSELVKSYISVSKDTRIVEIIEKAGRILDIPDIAAVGVILKGQVVSGNDTVGSLGVRRNEELQLLRVGVTRKPDDRKLVPQQLLPKLERTSYYTEPGVIQLARMTEKELATVEGFSIGNTHGKISFQGKTNLLGMDLDSLVLIAQGEVIVYPEDSRKPRLGEQLNKPAEIHLYNCFPKQSVLSSVYQDKLRAACEKEGSSFLSYDGTTGEWVFRVNHF